MKSATANHVMSNFFACYACVMSQIYLYLVYFILFILGGALVFLGGAEACTC